MVVDRERYERPLRAVLGVHRSKQWQKLWLDGKAAGLSGLAFVVNQGKSPSAQLAAELEADFGEAADWLRQS